MFWKKEKILKLKIGKVSESTIKENFPMVEREYNILIKSKKDKLNTLNKNILNTIKKELEDYVIHSLNISNSFLVYKRNYPKEDIYRLTPIGEKEVNRLFEELKLPKKLIKDSKLMEEINELEDELNYLRNKFKEDENY